MSDMEGTTRKKVKTGNYKPKRTQRRTPAIGERRTPVIGVWVRIFRFRGGVGRLGLEMEFFEV